MTTTFDELPRHPDLELRHAWDVLPHDVGTLDRLEPAAVRAAARAVQEGRTIALNLSLGEIDPPLFGRARLRHSTHAADRNTSEDVLDAFNPQASSQWDGFRHVRAREAGYFGGVTEFAPDDLDTLSIEHFARRGIAGRGVLVDIAGWYAAQGKPLDALAGEVVDIDVVEQTLRAQGTELAPGDILCLRFGWTTAYRALDAAQRGAPEVSARFSGLRGNEASARFLWDAQIAAVCADNPAIESAPGDRADGSLHRRLLPMLGMVMGELLDLDTLAEHCAECGRYDFFFVAVPLPVPGGLSSPSNAMAIV